MIKKVRGWNRTLSDLIETAIDPVIRVMWYARLAEVGENHTGTHFLTLTRAFHVTIFVGVGAATSCNAPSGMRFSFSTCSAATAAVSFRVLVTSRASFSVTVVSTSRAAGA